MKSDILCIILCWIISFIIYGLWGKYINHDEKKKGNKRGREKRKIKKL